MTTKAADNEHFFFFKKAHLDELEYEWVIFYGNVNMIMLVRKQYKCLEIPATKIVLFAERFRLSSQKMIWLCSGFENTNVNIQELFPKSQCISTSGSVLFKQDLKPPPTMPKVVFSPDLMYKNL